MPGLSRLTGSGKRLGSISASSSLKRLIEPKPRCLLDKALRKERVASSIILPEPHKFLLFFVDSQVFCQSGKLDRETPISGQGTKLENGDTK